MTTDLKQAVFALIKKILVREGVPPTDVTLESRISDIGMTSLSFAELVSELEQLYDVDPFDGEMSITDVVRVSDLIAAYQRHVA